MDPFSTALDFILDLIFLKLNQEDLHETLRVSKSWFWASIRRTKKLKITSNDNPLKSMAEFYNNHRPPNEKLDWQELFKNLVLDELVVLGGVEAINYLINNGCNTAELIIQTFGGKEVPVTLASLKTVTQLQAFEYRNNRAMKWHPFIIECMKSSDYEFDPNIECQIEAIKLNSSGWNAEDPLLHSVTKLSLRNVTIDFLRTMIDHCPNLKEVHCYRGTIRQDWHQVFPANVKRIELHVFDVDDDVARVVNAFTDAGRHLLPYLCQNWESVEKFDFDGCIQVHDQTVCKTVYAAFPQQREEVFVCPEFNEEMNLGSPLFQCRKIFVGCDGRKASRLNIPPTKSVTFEFLVERDFKFSPEAVCLEPEQVECFSFALLNWERVTHEPFVSNSFEGLTRLTSLTLSNVSASTIKMVLDQCPSIKKLNLNGLKAFTIRSMSRGSSYANVSALVLEGWEESMEAVFQVFPRLGEFKESHVICEAGDWLWRHLIEEDRKYGVVLVYERCFRSWYMVSDDLPASLSQAQKLLLEHLPSESVCYMKGFKLLPRFLNQKVIYIN